MGLKFGAGAKTGADYGPGAKTGAEYVPGAEHVPGAKTRTEDGLGLKLGRS